MLLEIPAPTPMPPRRLPLLPLPAYRFVPGLQPHPHKHPGGHGHAPELPPEALWLHGLDLFDGRYFWECHELLEGRWKALPQGDPERELLQGLIQAAAAALLAHLGRTEGAARMAGRAKIRLERAESTLGPDLPGPLHLPSLRCRLDAFLQGGPWPTVAP